MNFRLSVIITVFLFMIFSTNNVGNYIFAEDDVNNPQDQQQDESNRNNNDDDDDNEPTVTPEETITPTPPGEDEEDLTPTPGPTAEVVTTPIPAYSTPSTSQTTSSNNNSGGSNNNQTSSSSNNSSSSTTASNPTPQATPAVLGAQTKKSNKLNGVDGESCLAKPFCEESSTDQGVLTKACAGERT